MTKAVVLNASPRKAWNTAKLLKSAAEGARSAGSEVEYIDLYDLDFTGCRSCMLCKRKGAERCRCYWKDDLSPIVDKVFRSDVLLIGTAIYLGRPTSRYFEVMERLHFCALSYDDYSNYFTGRVNVGFFVSMNASKEFYDGLYKDAFEGYARELQMLNGEVCLYPCHDTLQVADYSKYSMAGFDAEKKQLSREKNFPKDLENAYAIGQRLVRESGR
ncbi:MAG: flavodoxin family protein [Atopobiaceae bacterium]|jgi:multimeric flavodoxin WrbA|nr:flavodoxin family protein [Atopobiaceae bacterium]MCH4119289.1 flavodoxin family protein [Atopobiaceae bacterium]MCI1318039.1 flavodoxin family protein [Atopobiaceae bacterium]MCI1388452.1 flavodoxin family protein [Atopobiaceae bacterium]MCI1431951.1 flavodoxin family protein [Atopobiaceae bacterium]